ncbi:MAG: ATP-binding protein [Myxococcota bacterium]
MANADGVSAKFLESLREDNLKLLRQYLPVTAAIMLAWSLLDWVLAPAHLTAFVTLRVGACVIAASAVTIASKTASSIRAIFAAWWVFSVCWNLAIAPMLVFVAGAPAPYIAGASIAMTVAGVYPVWPARLAASNAFVQGLVLLGGLVVGGASYGNLIFGFLAFGSIAVLATVTAGLRFDARQRLFETREALTDANSQLRKIDAQKNKFFANISHELRTPLTLILAPLNELLSSLGPSPERETLAIAKRNGDRLLRLIDDLLDLAKLEAGGLRLRVRELDLAALVRQATENAGPACKARGIHLRFESKGQPPGISGDPHRLEIVFTNLIGNAIKFTPEGGRIEVSVLHSAEGVTVSVSDTGPGIPKAQLTEIFQRFRQGEGPRGEHRGGVGIGLALAKELAEVHGGRLTVESVLGQGATFRVFLPPGSAQFPEDVVERRQVQLSEHPGRRAEDRTTSVPRRLRRESDSAEARGSSAPRGRILLDRGRTPRILLVEDEADLRQFIYGVLAQHFDVRTAVDGVEALEILQKQRPDLILTDIMMPKLSGIELCKAVKRDPSMQHIPVILLTAHGDSETALEGYDAGASDFVPKPFDTRVLLARVDAHLHMRALSLQVADQARLASAGTLAAGLAHEVKNPINAVLNAAKVLSGGGSSRVPSQKLIELIIDGAERVNDVVSALNAHARPADETDLQAVNVQEGIEATLRLMEHKSKEVRIHRAFESTERVRVPARAFNQIFLNLLDNAIRAGARSVWITLRERDGTVCVSVADDGPGVPDDLVCRIFDPFFTTREQGEGTGLGLHLARRIARECGGELRYTTRTGGGAEFVLEVPAMLGGAAAARTAPRMPSEPPQTDVA